MVKIREEKMEHKRRRIPGMPGVALVNGRGIVPDTDPLVTWVFSDVAGSTKLWEDYPDDMSKAIDMHNSMMRELLDEFAGHEIRNEGDSFALAFHDAIDAVQFCVKVGARVSASLLGHRVCSGQHGSTLPGQCLRLLFLAPCGCSLARQQPPCVGLQGQAATLNVPGILHFPDHKFP